jgi:hypothetical protein
MINTARPAWFVE